MEIASQTLNLINGRLGNANDHKLGYETGGNIQGQTFEEDDDGNQIYKPVIVSYTAKVIEGQKGHEWEINTMVL